MPRDTEDAEQLAAAAVRAAAAPSSVGAVELLQDIGMMQRAYSVRLRGCLAFSEHWLSETRTCSMYVLSQLSPTTSLYLSVPLALALSQTLFPCLSTGFWNPKSQST